MAMLVITKGKKEKAPTGSIAVDVRDGCLRSSLRARDISKGIAVDTKDVKKNTHPLLIIAWFAYRRLLIIHYLSRPSTTYHPLRSKDTSDNAMTPPVSVDRWDNDLPGPWRQCLSPGRQKEDHHHAGSCDNYM